MFRSDHMKRICFSVTITVECDFVDHCDESVVLKRIEERFNSQPDSFPNRCIEEGIKSIVRAPFSDEDVGTAHSNEPIKVRLLSSSKPKQTPVVTLSSSENKCPYCGFIKNSPACQQNHP